MHLLYITFAKKEEAEKLAETLLEEGLIACANIIVGSTSIYKWQGEVKSEQEVIMFAKAPDKSLEKAIIRARELHPYELPCILALPVSAGLPEFMAWVEQAACS